MGEGFFLDVGRQREKDSFGREISIGNHPGIHRPVILTHVACD